MPAAPLGESRDLDRQLQDTDAHRELLERLSADLIAGRRQFEHDPVAILQQGHLTGLDGV